MKNKNQIQIKKKLTLSKEKVAILNNAMLNTILGGDGGKAGEPSFTYTQPTASVNNNC
jgi:hypothetical protein